MAGAVWGQSAATKRICVAALWHTVNIGDIAHGPGLVRLIERHVPGVEVSFWPKRQPTAEIRAMLARDFPKLAVIEGAVSAEGKASSPDFAEAMARCDLMILGSGGYHDGPVKDWRQLARRPYGVFGNGFESMTQMPREIAENLNAARFVYGRESLSAETLKRFGITAPGLTFCPDSTFGFDLRDEKRADEVLARAGLEAGKFICVIPNLRHTPHWKAYGWKPTEKDLLGEKMNEEFKAKDHAAVREAIVAWVRETGLKVLACPEMTYQMALAKEQLIDPLPDDVKRNVAWQEKFWMPDEAAAVYARAVAIVSLECHSPILALANGTPAIHIQLPTDTRKAQMFRDIGVGEWLHEVADVTGPKLAAQLLDIHANPQGARAKVMAAMDRVNTIYRDVFARVGEALGA
jgi:polysaccharide pyruvyl transferase WcaK-like protein